MRRMGNARYPQIIIERACTIVSASLLELQLRSIRYHARSSYTPAAMRVWCAMARAEATSDAQTGLLTYIARHHGRILGYGRINPIDGFIGALYVDRGQTGHGVGTALLNAMECAARPYRPVALSVDASLNAVAFYGRQGFVAMETLAHLHPSGVELPVVRMSKWMAR